MDERMGAIVVGRCPECGLSALFLGKGGHVTCGNLECKNPTLADDYLRRGFSPGPKEVVRPESLASRIWGAMTDDERAEVVKRRGNDGPG